MDRHILDGTIVCMMTRMNEAAADRDQYKCKHHGLDQEPHCTGMSNDLLH
jgi:hypothetical protein